MSSFHATNGRDTQPATPIQPGKAPTSYADLLAAHKPEINTILVVSTANLTDHTVNVWLPQNTDINYHPRRDGIGGFVHVHEHHYDDLADFRAWPLDMQMLILVARAHKVNWVLIDNAADTHPLLPSFDW